MLLLAFLANPVAVLAADEECDTSVSFSSPANDLCVPALSASAINVDGIDTEWTAGTFYDYTDYSGAVPGARARVSRQATGIDKSTLHLFFDVSGDAVPTFYDEIRIGLNPGTNAANSTLLKVYPFSAGNPAPATFYNFASPNWTSAGVPGSWFAFNKTQNVGTGTWTVEVKISLDQIPTHPITGSTFRLYLELIADDNVTKIPYQWPAHYGFVGTHDFACSNPARWRPMSFGTGCFADLNIANGAYSCDAIYVLRGGLKSSELGVSSMNEIHADVTNPPGTHNAAGVQVYLTTLRAGISTGPVAMNFDHNDPIIKQFFTDKYGAWLTPTDKLDTGTPKPPTAFSVNAGTTNTAARFNWKPSDETRFGSPADFIGTHKCLAAFADFKDDPNFANNFSYCNISAVACPAGEICKMGFAIGPYFAYRGRQEGEVLSRIKVTAINAPPDFLKLNEFRLEGPGVKPVGENVYELNVPGKGEIQMNAAINIRRGTIEKKETKADTDLIPTAHAQQPPVTGAKDGVGGGSNIARDLSDFLGKKYPGKPIVFLQGLAQTAHETALGGEKGTVPLSRPTGYVAFVIDTGAGVPPTPTPGGTSPKCSCGKSTASSFLFSSLFVMGGLAMVWRRSRRSTKKGRSTKTD